MAQPSDLQTQLNSIQWTNGSRAITGAIILGIFTTIFGTLSGMGTWTNGVYAPNLTQSAISAGLGGQLVFTPTPGPQTNLYSAPPANGFYASGLPSFSYYPIVGGNPFDNARAQTYIPFTTVADAGFFESGLVVNSHIVTGVAPPWATGTAYTAGQSVLGGNGASVYTAQNSGTSGATQPSCASGTCSDGAVTWQFRQVNAYFGKAGSAFYTVAGPGAPGAAWGMYENYQTQAGSNVTASFAHEIDTQNNDVNCAIGARTCAALFIGGQPNKPMTAALYVNPQGTPSQFAYHFGQLLNGANVADVAGIDEDTQAPIGLVFNYLGVGSTHSIATIQDNSTSPSIIADYGHHVTGINLSGVYSANQIAGSNWAIAASGQPTFNAGVLLGGTPATGINDTGSHTTGINLGGTYGAFQIAGAGWGVGPVGNATFKSSRLTPITVGALPTCSSAIEGTKSYVTDATTLTYGGAPTGGGNIGTTVLCSRSGATPVYAWSMH